MARQGATMALTLAKLQLPLVDLGAVDLGVPKETSNKLLEEAKSTVVPLVAVVAGIINDRLLLIDEYLEEDDAPSNALLSS